jgi:hypothetical protein
VKGGVSKNTLAVAKLLLQNWTTKTNSGVEKDASDAHET